MRITHFLRLPIAVALTLVGFSAARAADSDSLNSYILRAVERLYSEYGKLGYGNSALTHDMKFGDNGVLKSQSPPLTMCVAAQLEVLVEALNIYAQETGDYSAFHYLPKVSWERLRPLDLRGQIWVVQHSPSHGAADAFEKFGIGVRTSFKDVRPGSFLNFNRINGSGHGVIFLGFLNKLGEDLPSFSDEVAGFKYFSSNGQVGVPGGGLDYRWAFFSDVACPALSPEKKRDCGVIRTDRTNYTVPGHVLLPKLWDHSKANRQLFQMQQSAGDPIYATEGTFRADFFTGRTTDE